MHFSNPSRLLGKSGRDIERRLFNHAEQMMQCDTCLAMRDVVQNDLCPILRARLRQLMNIRHRTKLRICSGFQCRDLIQHFR